MKNVGDAIKQLEARLGDRFGGVHSPDALLFALQEAEREVLLDLPAPQKPFLLERSAGLTLAAGDSLLVSTDLPGGVLEIFLLKRDGKRAYPYEPGEFSTFESGTNSFLEPSVERPVWAFSGTGVAVLPVGPATILIEYLAEPPALTPTGNFACPESFIWKVLDKAEASMMRAKGPEGIEGSLLLGGKISPRR